MQTVKQKLDKKVLSRNLRREYMNLQVSLNEFKKKVYRGERSVGAICFSGSEAEKKAIKQVCRYWGFELVSCEKIDCTLMHSNKDIEVVHYNIS